MYLRSEALPENNKEKLKLYNMAKMFIREFLLKMTDPIFIRAHNLEYKKYSYENSYMHMLEEMNIRSIYPTPNTNVIEHRSTLKGNKNNYLRIKIFPKIIISNSPNIDYLRRNFFPETRNNFKVEVEFKGVEYVPRLIINAYKDIFGVTSLPTGCLSHNNYVSATKYFKSITSLFEFDIQTPTGFLNYGNVKALADNWIDAIGEIYVMGMVGHFLKRPDLYDKDCFAIRKYYPCPEGRYDPKLRFTDNFNLESISNFVQVLGAIVHGF